MNVEDTSAVRTKPFYQLGGNLPADAPSYVRRGADVDLLKHLLAGRFCYVLTSRQMGKSSLMVQTARKLREADTRVAVLDLTRIGQNLSPEQWYDGLLIPLGREFHLEDELDDFWNSKDAATLKMGPMQRWISAIREVILRSTKSRIVIFIDEIDAVRGLPFSTDEFFAGIRQFYNERTIDPELERITFCLLGVAKPSDLIRNVNTTPFNVGHRIELTDFTEAEAEPLLAGLGRDEQLERKLLRRVLWWTGGHPYLTQRMCSKIAEDPGVMSDADVDLICTNTFLSSRAREKDDNLLFVRERVLRSEVDRASLLDLYGQVQGGKKVVDDDASTLVDTLRLAGLVMVSGDRLVVRNRIYAHVFDKRWIRLNMPDAELRRQRRAFRNGIGLATAVAAVVFGIVGLLVLRLSQADRLVEMAYVANMTDVQQAFDAGDFREGTSLLKQWIEPVGKDEPQAGFEWKWLWARSGGESITSYYGHRDEVRSVAISPDPIGRLIVTAGADSTVRVFDRPPEGGGAPSCEQTLDPDMEAPPTAPTLSPVAGSTKTISSSIYSWVRPHPINRCFTLLRALVVDTDHVTPLVPGDAGWKESVEDLKSPHGAKPGVTSVQFSPDGAWIAITTESTCSKQSDCQVYLWSTSDPRKTISVHVAGGGKIHSVSFRSNQEFATAGEDGSESFEIEPDGSVRRNAAYDTTGKLAHGGMKAAAFSPRDAVTSKSRYYAMVDGDGYLDVKDMERPEKSRYEQVDPSGLTALTFYDENTILVGSSDGIVWQIDLSKPVPKKPRPSLAATGQGMINSLTVSGKRDVLIVTGSDSTVLVWRLDRDGDHIDASGPNVLRGHTGEVYAAAITSDQKLIVSGSADKSVRFWARQPLDLNGDLSYASHSERIDSDAAATLLAFSPPDGKQLAYIRGVTSIRQRSSKSRAPGVVLTRVIFYNIEKGEWYTGYSPHGLGTALAYSADGRYVATAAEDGTVQIWDTKKIWDTGATYVPMDIYPQTERRTFSSLVFSPDGTLAGTSAGSILLWQPNPQAGNGIETYKLVKVISPPPGSERVNRVALAFSQDARGKWLAVCNDDASGSAIEIWNSADLYKPKGSAFQVLRGGDAQTKALGPCTSVAFSPDSRWFAAGTSSRDIAVWDVAKNWERVKGDPTLEANGKGDSALQVAPPQAAAAINTVSFSPDSRLLASATADAKILLWDVLNRRALPTVAEHSGGVLSIAFSPNGRCLASGSTDGTLLLTPTADPRTRPANDPSYKPLWIPFGSYWSSCVGSPEK